ncbi:hypothetical protein T10_12224 [Trichinella papuae]|uniref:Uncharacterized protein n=1 Tax=Trichinella papuae TaxID=268474 RepID=A0A0V1M2I1_9BILA|nr:hypothetical protein T10_12224 [Trichinella papuae]
MGLDRATYYFLFFTLANMCELIKKVAASRTHRKLNAIDQ